MNLVKKILAFALCAVMALSVVGCHKKDEIAIIVGDYEFTAAYYMCALIYADMDARVLVDEQLAEKAEKDDSIKTDKVDYSKQKIDGKKFETYVKEKALENIKRVAAYKTKCAELKLKFDDEVLANAGAYAEHYWTQYGYSEIFEPNDVSLETMKSYMMDAYYASMYFTELYGEGGEREIPATDVQKSLTDHFVLVNFVEATYEAEATDESKAALKEKIDNYANSLNSGALTIDDVYLDYYGPEEESEDDITVEGEAEIAKPIDEDATILGDEETQYTSEYYETAKELAVGTATVVAKSDSSGLVLIYKKDILTDPYYLENLDNTLRELVEGKNLEKEMLKFAKTLEFTEITRATKIFKIKDIKYPENPAESATVSATAQ